MQNLESLIHTIQHTHKTLKSNASSSVNVALTVRNWLVGYYIVNYEQNGKDRAEYGAKTLQILADNLNAKDGFSHRNLKLYRQFFTEYKNLHSAVKQYVLQLDKNTQALFPELVKPQILLYLEEPSHDKNFDTHADDYNAQHGKTCRQSIVGELHLTYLIKFKQMKRKILCIRKVKKGNRQLPNYNTPKNLPCPRKSYCLNYLILILYNFYPLMTH